MIPNQSLYDQTESQIVNDLLPISKRQPIWQSWLSVCLQPLQWCHDIIFNNYANGTSLIDAPNWVTGTTYNYLDKIIYIDNGVYESQSITPFVSTITPNLDTTNWVKICDSFIGIREQIRYNFQKLSLEYALNRYFQVSPFSVIEWSVTFSGGVPTTHLTPPYTQIYIKGTGNVLSNFWLSNGGIGALTSYMPNSSNYSHYYLGNSYSTYNAYQFTVYVPSALYTTIGNNQPLGVSADDAIRSVVDKYTLAGSNYNITTY